MAAIERLDASMTLGCAPHPARQSARTVALIEKRTERLRTLSPRSRKPGADRPAMGRLGQPLSRREIEVVSLLARGQRMPQIARTLNISVRTVKFFVDKARAKSGTSSRIDLVLWWAQGRSAVLDPGDVLLAIARVESELAAAKASIAGLGHALAALKVMFANGSCECPEKITS